MSTPSEKELRELDFWIAENVLGWQRGKKWGNGNGEWTINGLGYAHHGKSWGQTPSFTADPAAAMMVWKQILSRYSPVSRQRQTDGFYYVWINNVQAEGETLEIAICRFARKLFEK